MVTAGYQTEEAQENANEMFYNKARLPKNVLAYAISADIEDINKVKDSLILNEILGSDHCPIKLIIEE